ncbi:MAG: ABC transporter ATP-binding protein [Oscillospiraceae bacterium]
MNLEIKKLNYGYEKSKAPVLQDVNFTIEAGRVTAIIGPSGCGKTTLANILSGVIPGLIATGTIDGYLNKQEGLQISVVSQTPENQLFGYGVTDAIAFGIENLGLPQEELHRRTEDILDMLNIQHLRSRPVSTLSGGQRQAVCIASVLAMKPDVLIMDEPVSSLDPNGKQLIQTILGRLREAGQTTIVLDNNLDWVLGIVDHIIALKEGRVAFNGTREEFFAEANPQQFGASLPQLAELSGALLEKGMIAEPFLTMEEAQQALQGAAPAAAPRTMPPEKAEAAPPILEAVQVTKQFGQNFEALHQLNAAFPKGKITAILGQNGSGKTTLVKHLNGLLKPTSGDVLHSGTTLLGKTVAQISKDVLLVFQHPEHMLFENTVYEELTFCARTQKTPFEEETALAILEEYGLLENREDFPPNLPMGKKHILTILSVLLSEAGVVILDEPTLGMDACQKLQLERIVRALAAQGRTVILISHEIPLVFKLCDFLLIMKDGEKQAQGGNQALAQQEEVFLATNLQLPPVVALSRQLGLAPVCCDVPSFVKAFAGRLQTQTKEAALG